NSIRPIPLTQAEISGYRKMDSLARVQAAEAIGDTVRASRHRGFQLWDIVIGDRYELGERSNLKLNPGGGFNTVEGFYAWRHPISRFDEGKSENCTDVPLRVFCPTFQCPTRN